MKQNERKSKTDQLTKIERERKRDRQTDRPTERQRDRETDRQTEMMMRDALYICDAKINHVHGKKEWDSFSVS